MIAVVLPQRAVTLVTIFCGNGASTSKSSSEDQTLTLVTSVRTSALKGGVGPFLPRDIPGLEHNTGPSPLNRFVAEDLHFLEIQ